MSDVDFSKFEVPVLVTRIVDGRRVRNIPDVDLVAYALLSKEVLAIKGEDGRTLAEIIGAKEGNDGFYRAAPIDFFTGRIDVLRLDELLKLNEIMGPHGVGVETWLTQDEFNNQMAATYEGI